LGWALTGACPGPLVALIGNRATVMIAGLLSAPLGTWVYGGVRPKLSDRVVTVNRSNLFVTGELGTSGFEEEFEL